MNEHERRLEGLRYRLDNLRGQIPHSEFAGMWGRIEGRQRAIELGGDGYPDAKMRERINEIEDKIEGLEDEVAVPS